MFMRGFLILTCCLLINACTSRVTGEVAKACVAADRKAASNTLCSCVQRAANRTLNASDQARAATFFEDPQLAQDTRQAGTRSTSSFWKRYRNFTDTARASCG